MQFTRRGFLGSSAAVAAGVTSAYAANERTWLESIRTRKPAWEDAAAGHRAAACAHMVNLSAKEQRTVAWDFERDGIRRG